MTFRFPPAGQRAVALLLGVVFALFCAEAALRLYGFLHGTAQETRNRIAVGREGYRIMCLGESTTAGGNGAWPALLERLLAQRYPLARFSVINKGIPSVTTSIIMRELDKNLREVRPHMVIAMMGMNDGFIRYYEGINDTGSPLFRHLRIYRLFRILFNRDKAARPLPVPEKAHQAPARGLIDPYMRFQDGRLDMSRHEDDLRKKIGRDPGDAASLYLLGRYLIFHKGPREQGPGPAERGKELLMRAASLEPENPFVLWTLSMYHIIVKNDPGRGIPLLQKATELNPTAENWNNLGSAYSASGMTDKAEQALRRSLLSQPDGAGQMEGAALELGTLYIRKGDLSKAEEVLQKARSRDPYNEKISGALARLYEEAGCGDLAREYAAKLSTTRALFTATTRTHFRELYRTLRERGIRLAVMQYPLCDPEPLKKLFGESGDIIFINNQPTFRKAVGQRGYDYYFQDMFAGNFGHCTTAGSELIARNAADALAGYISPLRAERRAKPAGAGEQPAGSPP